MATITVTATDSSGAMEQVLAQLGPDAYILDSRSEGSKFHIQATDDPAEAAKRRKAKKASSDLSSVFAKVPLGQSTNPSQRQTQTSTAISSSDETLEAISAELSDLRSMLRGMTLTNMTGLKPEFGESPALSLSQAGFSERVIRSLFTPLAALEPELARSEFLDNFADRLVQNDSEWLHQSRILCVVGASGSGKTTLTGKLAAFSRSKSEAKPLDLACMSGKASMMQEPIAACGRLLNLTPTALSAKGLSDELAETSRRLVIDVAVSAKDAVPALSAAQKKFGKDKMQVILALPGASSARMISSQMKKYATLKPIIAMTKLDECETTPSELCALAEARAQIGLMTGTKSFIDGIAIAQAEILAQYLSKNF